MADTQFLNNKIVRNATVGAQPPHGPVKTGELPLVNVKAAPGGPQIQEGQQRPVTILPPRDAKSAVTTGGLPLVSVKMGPNGAQPDDGRDQPVVIKDNRHGAVNAGGLPMIAVKMTEAGRQVQTLPTVSGGPPQIPAAAPALSAPRGTPMGGAARSLPGGPHVAHVTRVPIVGGAPMARVGTPQQRHVAAPQAAQAPQVTLPPIPEMTTDQLMLCRFTVDKYLGDLRAAVEAAPETAGGLEIIKLCEETIEVIDQVTVSTAIRAEAIAQQAAAAEVAVPVAAVAVAPPPVQRAASTSIAAAPQVSYVAGRVGGHTIGGARVQRNAGMAPRKTSSGRSTLPMVKVRMNGQQADVENRAQVEQVREQVLIEKAERAATSDADALSAITSANAEIERLRAELETARVEKKAAVEVVATETEPKG
jgi:hypothetical protein